MGAELDLIAKRIKEIEEVKAREYHEFTAHAFVWQRRAEQYTAQLAELHKLVGVLTPPEGAKGE